MACEQVFRWIVVALIDERQCSLTTWRHSTYKWVHHSGGGNLDSVIASAQYDIVSHAQQMEAISEACKRVCTQDA